MENHNARGRVPLRSDRGLPARNINRRSRFGLVKARLDVCQVKTETSDMDTVYERYSRFVTSNRQAFYGPTSVNTLPVTVIADDSKLLENNYKQNIHIEFKCLMQVNNSVT